MTDETVELLPSTPNPWPEDSDYGKFWRRGYDAGRADAQSALLPTLIATASRTTTPVDAELVERMGESLFALSDSIRLTNLLDYDKHHARYEAVVSAWRDLSEAIVTTPVEPQGWQPIDTAPRIEGQEILGFVAWPTPCRFVVIWNVNEWYAGWGSSLQPTHWRPLPEPPAVTTPVEDHK